MFIWNILFAKYEKIEIVSGMNSSRMILCDTSLRFMRLYTSTDIPMIR